MPHHIMVPILHQKNPLGAFSMYNLYMQTDPFEPFKSKFIMYAWLYEGT